MGHPCTHPCGNVSVSSQSDGRTIIYIYIFSGGKKADLMNNYPEGDKYKYAIFDMARCNTPECFPWNFMETLKSGHFMSTKYMGGCKVFRKPKICVMMNQEPPLDKLSEDRWDILRLDEISDEHWRLDSCNEISCKIHDNIVPDIANLDDFDYDEFWNEINVSYI